MTKDIRTTEEVATKVRVELELEKKLAFYLMKFNGQLKNLPDGSATFDKRVLYKTINRIRRLNEGK
jgi:hypothetical protein|tara:strand:+ start:3501 stop:3698 length:198 start_codon:yes stop_codon:yes gene_type:complete